MSRTAAGAMGRATRVPGASLAPTTRHGTDAAIAEADPGEVEVFR